MHHRLSHEVRLHGLLRRGIFLVSRAEKMESGNRRTTERELGILLLEFDTTQQNTSRWDMGFMKAEDWDCTGLAFFFSLFGSSCRRSCDFFMIAGSGQPFGMFWLLEHGLLSDDD